ncbi:MAG: DUF86 domain-containing protein [Spirochaetales bacterium]|nr:DUF86 domain-containing protein [Spirochaetales bacterium]
MVNPLISSKVDSLIRCLERIESKKPAQIENLIEDYDLQDIISVNLERAIQISVDIAAIIIAEKGLKTAQTMSSAFKALSDSKIIPEELSLKLQKSVGFRNISVHEYCSIDWEIVFDIIHNHLVNFRDFIRSVTLSLD